MVPQLVDQFLLVHPGAALDVDLLGTIILLVSLVEAADVDHRVTTPGEVLNIIMDQIVPEIQKAYPDLKASVTGESEDRREDLASLGRNMLIALLVIFVMLECN